MPISRKAKIRNIEARHAAMKPKADPAPGWDDMTISELKTALENAGVDYPSRGRKSEYVALAASSLRA
jgi:hypothetical protein